MSNRPPSPSPDSSELLTAFERGRARGLRSIPREIPREPTQDTVASDPLAQAEMRRFEQGDYEHEARRSRHFRGEAAKGTLHRLKLYMLWFGVGIFGVLNLVWLCHVALPEKWRWLPPAEVTLIQNIIGAVWIGKIAIFLERYVNKHSDDE